MAPPTRTDDQILPRIRWVPIGKSNCYLDVERSQSNPIYKIVVDILKHTNFFRAFTASSTIPSIYIQQFWETVRYENKTGNYSCQLDEQWFDLTKDTLRDALQITPVDTNNAFSSPPTLDALIKAPITVINLCLMGKTSGFERPRAPVLQILWGIVNRAHIDYAEMMWEEFTQSIHTFIEDKKNLAQHTQGKKKATLIVIPSVRFTKLIIYYLQSKHKFHPRPHSLLHLPNEEHVLGYLKFSAKGTKREVFGMPIPNYLITDDIRGEQYYNAYLEKVAKHQRYLVGEEEKKRKLVTETSEAPSLAKRSKAGKVVKQRTKKSSLQLVDEFVDKGVPENEPRIGDEEADLQKAVEESLKEFHSDRQGPLPPVVIREPESGKFQPLPEVQGKGKEKRRTSTQTEPTSHDKSSSLYVELGLTDSEMDSDEEVPRIDAGVQDEGQAGPNPGEQDKDQAGPNPDKAAASQPPSSHVVLAGPDLEHMNLEASDTSLQPNPEQMDEEFTTTAYPNVQENLKLLTEGEVRLEEPASSAGTLSSLQNLDKELRFTNQFLSEKSQEDEPEKTNIEAEVQSMVTVPIHQDTSSIPLMTTLIIDLTVSQPVPTVVQAPLPTITATATATTTTTTTLPIHLLTFQVSDPDSPAPKSAKATKPKASKQSKPLAPKDKNFSSICAYTIMMLLRVRNHHGGNVYIRDLVDFDVTMSTSRGKNFTKKKSMKKAFQDMLHELGGELIQLMHTTMVPEQVKTMKIQAGIQVSSPGELKDNFNFGSALETLLYYVVTNDMFQPWRALTTVINLCLTGKTSGFERPRAPVLQILWGIVNRAHIDYAERMWEEFTQSIHTFIEDKKNLAQHTQGKKKATLIVIPSVRFTKLIVYYLQSKHKFHPRPGSPLHLPNEEPVLGYLKFSAKGTKREVFGMPIPNDLITDDIRGEQYYNAYLEKVAKHQRYLAGEEVSDPDSPAPKPTKTAKPKASKQSKPLAPKVATKKPKPAPAKPQEKKRKLVMETSEAPSPAKRSKAGKVVKKRTKKSSLQLVDEFLDEGVPENEPSIGDEEVDLQKAVEEILKEVHSACQGPLLPVVIREPESGKFQLLPEVQGKDQFIFQRRTSTPTESSGHDESSSLYVELGLTESETDFDEEVPGMVARVQAEGQGRPNPGELDEGQAGSNPGDAVASQPPSSHVENLRLPTEGEVRLEEPASLAGTLSSLQHLDKELNFADQFLVEKSQEDEPEKTNAESEVQSMVTVPIHQDTSSVPLMTTPIIDLTRIGELEQHMADLVQANLAQEERMDKHGSKLYKLKNLNIPHQVSKAVDEVVTDAVDWAIQAPLRDRFRDLPEAYMKEILHHRMWESNSYQAHEDHKMLYEALEKSMASDHTDQLLTDLAEVRRKKKKRHASPKTPPGSPPHQPPPPPPPVGSSRTPRASEASGSSQLPPPSLPPSTNQSDQSTSPDASSSSKTAASAEYTAWTTTDTRLKPSISSIPEELHMDDARRTDRPATLEPAWSIPSSDLPVSVNNWASALASTYAPPLENSLLAQTGDMAIFMDWFCKKQGITELKQQDLEGPAYEIVNVFHPNVIHLQYQMEECYKLLTDQVDDSIIRPALSISKMKAAYYLDVGLEQMVPDQMWIEEECKHTSEGDRKAARTHMRILSVVRIEVFSLYGYDYMKKIVLRRADLKEYTIAERDFKYMYPSDFEYLYLLNLQGHLDHLPPEEKKTLTTAVNLWTRNLVIRQRIEDLQLGIESYQIQLNLTKPRWDATGFEFKHDFTVIDSLRAVTFKDKYGVQMIMRFNEIHKFSDDTLQLIDEALDYRVKEFKVNRMNPGLNTRVWTRKDVDRSKEFMFTIQKRLKTRRIFYNLESFVGFRNGLRQGGSSIT
ncbi:retrovirus-related pol polyprotein from transposon TNT 1-94 [Tanacetum coccineum]|uniref:Retrovirus-related pol polyprotein from transposon TNT 1-94 n=1 Tax=Tanacetum coccineum TaxID=301880 RepID=A0ABQ5AJ46_9ASTR